MKAIYSPNGNAGEYAKYACNFYVGCSNQCQYCYCRKGVLATALGGDKPTLKKCFRDEAHALDVFEKELKANLSELQKYGLFFSFTTDPMLIAPVDTLTLTTLAVQIAAHNDVPSKILTKDVRWVKNGTWSNFIKYGKLNDRIAFGFSLTGRDDLEPNASTNAERIEAMRKLHEAGFKTFASIEPIIDFDRSWDMVRQTLEFCDLYKIGLKSGSKCNKEEVRNFVETITRTVGNIYGDKIYFKDSLLKAAGINREDLPNNCVKRNYNIFK